jgi:hypothetical protein
MNLLLKNVQLTRHFCVKSSTLFQFRNNPEPINVLPDGRRPLRKPGREFDDNIKTDLKKYGVTMWIGFIWLRIGTSGGLL